MVTAHDAFGYFGERYGIEVVGIQGISTLAEAGLQDVQRVVDLVVERGIGALFVESSVPRRTDRGRGGRGPERGHEVAIGGELVQRRHGAGRNARGHLPGHGAAQCEYRRRCADGNGPKDDQSDDHG